MKKWVYVHTVTVCLAFVGALLPFGAVSQIPETVNVTGGASALIEKVSFFDFVAWENGNVGPMIAAVLICLLVGVTLLPFLFKERPWMCVAMFVLSIAALAATLLPLVMFGWVGYTATALTIVYLLACSVLLSFQRMTGRYFRYPEEEDDGEEEAPTATV